MSYKAASKFLDYINRSNRFVDRILAGGNRGASDVIVLETDSAALFGAIEALELAKPIARERVRKARATLAKFNSVVNGSHGKVIVDGGRQFLRDEAERRHNEAVSEVDWLEIHLRLLRQRLLILAPEPAAMLHERELRQSIEELRVALGNINQRAEKLERRLKNIESAPARQIQPPAPRRKPHICVTVKEPWPSTDEEG